MTKPFNQKQTRGNVEFSVLDPYAPHAYICGLSSLLNLNKYHKKMEIKWFLFWETPIAKLLLWNIRKIHFCEVILCSLTAKVNIKRETSIFFYHCLALHYVFYCRGEERGEEQRRLTVVLPSTALIGWSRQATAAVSSVPWINVVPYCVAFSDIVDILFFNHCCWI